MKNLLFLLAGFLIFSYSFSQNLNHDLSVKINIPENAIDAVDIISLPESFKPNDNTILISLNKNLKISPGSESYSLEILSRDEKESNMNSYKLILKDKDIRKLEFKYAGKIFEDITTGAAEYARGFSETSGIIFEKGVFLAGSTHWIPEFQDLDLFTFTLNVSIDSAWKVVSQGERTINKKEADLRIIQYNSPNPVDEIYLIAAPWTEYSIETDNVLVQAFLRTPDEELASRYLKVTSEFLQLYNALIGPYPYKKFALVENFWETGYGMPSFTLLGEKVIRFPWILYSSYPHELLHNYWGNSVYVNYESGNWCEGITAYMADHLIKEQQGQGAEYRRTTLQKFTDFVNEENDFPVVDFRSRNNSAEEAIGYGKVLMINEMLRSMLGDYVFVDAYQYFYKNYKFKKASFVDLQTSFEKISGKDLSLFFNQWLNRKGAPEIVLSGVNISSDKEQNILEFTLEQKQEADVFIVNIPVAVYLEDADMVKWETVIMDNKMQKYSLSYKSKPVKIEIDPEFNVFRKLDVKEVPPSLSQVQGSRNSKIILPKESNLYSAYLELANSWAATQKVQGKTIEIINDTEIKNLPESESFWVLGKENKFATAVSIPAEYNATLSDVILDDIQYANNNGSLVYAIPHPANEAITIAYLQSNTTEAIQGLTRKLPHYGKYGYLGFEGNAPENNLKGSFTAANSPLNGIIQYNGVKPEIKAKIIPRKALVN